MRTCFFEVPLAHRFILFVAFYLQLALVWLILRVIDNWQTTPRSLFDSLALWGTIAILLGVITFNVRLLQLEFSGLTMVTKSLKVVDKRAQIPGRRSVVELYAELTEPLPADGVVLTTPRLGWPLPTVKAKVVSLFHENPMLVDQAERYVATMDFFYKPLSDQERSSIVRRYQATHLLADSSDTDVDPTLSAWLQRYAAAVSVIENYRMYDIDLASLPAPAVQARPRRQPRVEPEVAPVPAPVSQLPAETPATEPPEADADDTQSEDAAFGAPIAEPLLNPERHGG